MRPTLLQLKTFKDLDLKKKKEGKFTIFIAWPVYLGICDIVPIPYLRVSTPFQGAIINVLQLT